ncbi:MAG: GNAT family N-acetyltransferase [Oscillospiraceae bacterium]|nr:GNAT family N-acetyltransferase [Oscillospiraceae bacterium]
MTKDDMLRIVQAQLALDLNCTVEQLNGEKDSLVFVHARDNPGRRPFPRGEQHFDMLTMGRAIVVSATPDILATVQPALAGKSRDEAFSMPFVYGHALLYLPDLDKLKLLDPPTGYTYEFVERDKIPTLCQQELFEHSIGNFGDHPRPDVLVLVAKQDGQIVGMAGCCEDCATMWQIGMDVLPDFRSRGLAAYLVNALMLEILRRNKVPYYCTSPANIPSQRVAHRAGFAPAWVCAYRGQFSGCSGKFDGMTAPTN